jgi:Rieske Fe-S protein
LIRKKRGTATTGSDGFVKVTTVAALPPDGSPRPFPVFMDRQDAWNKFPNAEVGAVFLSLQPDGTVRSFNARCPHLGCTINYSPNAKQYICPCHASAFSLDGERTNAVPPRSMDPLQAEIRNSTEVWVQFQSFRAGTSERKVLG